MTEISSPQPQLARTLPARLAPRSSVERHNSVNGLFWRTPAKVGGEHVHFGGFGAARLGLDVTDLGERQVEPCDKIPARAALKRLTEECAAWDENILGEIERRLDQAHDAQMIGGSMPGRRCVHVGQDHIRLPSTQGLD